MDIYEDFVKVAKMLSEMNTPAHTQSFTAQAIPLDIKPCPSNVDAICGWGNKPKEGSKPMASYAQATVINPASIEAEQREIVRSALRTQRESIRAQLRKDFGLVDDDEPRTPAEFIKRIADGQYTIDEKYLDYRSYAPWSYVRWRDPKKVEDKAGFKAAEEKLDASYQDAKLKAALLPIADLLQLVEDFKAFKA